MTHMKIIQLQASVAKPIGVITDEVRNVVSNICLGIDDMKFLGNKALVLRAEIYPKKLQALYDDLSIIGITISKQSLPELDQFGDEIEYPLSLQIISFSDDTDRKVIIPNVPG